MEAAWYRLENEQQIASPALVVYPQRIEENIRRMIAMAGGTERLRPHVKTHKMVEVVRLQQRAGIERFKCSTIAEAEMLARSDATDVQLAYPMVGPNIGRFARLVDSFRGVRFSTIADDETALRALANVLREADAEAGVLVDLDVGLHRSGIEPDERAIALYRLIDALPGVRPGGLHIYDGHIKDSDPRLRRQRVEHDYAAVWQLRDELVRQGFDVPEVVVGGTPTFPIHAGNPRATCSPGTCLLWDYGYASRFPDIEFLHAACLLGRVISRPDGGRLCLDLGYKAVSPDHAGLRVWLIDLPDAEPCVHNEEHLTVRVADAQAYAVGTSVYGIPYHICPTTALHREAVVAQHGKAVDVWSVAARDRKLTI